jgi:hypothetical protein
MQRFKQGMVVRGDVTIWLEHAEGAGLLCLFVGGVGAIRETAVTDER